MDKHNYRLTCEQLGRRWLFRDGFQTSISITHFKGYDGGIYRDYYKIYTTERGGTFLITLAKTLERAREIGIEYNERGEKNG